MGWTHEEYLAQPAWLIDAIKVSLHVEAEYARESRKTKLKG